MKKLKIFLLLSILLCFGFVLSPEVHAQGDGPKEFEVGDVLPATTQLRISWTATTSFIGKITSDSGAYYIVEDSFPISRVCGIGVWDEDDGEWIPPYTEYGGNHAYVDVDTTSWDINKRTIYSVNVSSGSFTWEDLNPVPTGPKIFEEEDELPAGYIKISWDFTDKPIPEEAEVFVVSSGDDVFDDLIIQIFFGWTSNIQIDINYKGNLEFLIADTPGFVVIPLTESVTITDLDGTDDYNVYIHGALSWEVVSQDYFNGFMATREIYGYFDIGGYWFTGEQAWNKGYDIGSEQSWEDGFEYGMEIYGYYDPITEQWLSVSGYLELYGTDKPGQSDFYNNFDKYFIPAMIIVFGGAIALTALKVFKGRE